MRPSLSLRLVRLRDDRRGAGMIEFAFLAPLFVMMLFGAFEISRYVHFHQKADNALHSVTSLINRNNQIDERQLENITKILPDLARPYDIDDYKLIVTFVNFDEEKERPMKVGCFENRANGPSSRVWRPGSDEIEIDLPSMRPKDQMLTVELFFEFSPVLKFDFIEDLLGLEEGRLYKHKIDRPRFGAFQTVPTCPSARARRGGSGVAIARGETTRARGARRRVASSPRALGRVGAQRRTDFRETST